MKRLRRYTDRISTGKVILAMLAILTVAVALLLAALLLKSQSPEPAPVAMRVTGFEPAGIFDDNGEMWIVTLQVAAARPRASLVGSPPFPSEGPVYIKDDDNSQARVSNRWLPLDKVVGLRELYVYQWREVQFIVPTNTDVCRLRLKWARGRLVSGRFWLVAQNLPPTIRDKLRRFHSWPRYVPSSDWQGFSMDLPLAAEAITPAFSQ